MKGKLEMTDKQHFEMIQILILPQALALDQEKLDFLGPFCSKYLSGTSGKLFLNTPRGNLANTTKKNTMLKEIDMLFGSSCIDDVLKTYGEIFFCSLQSENGMKRALY